MRIALAELENLVKKALLTKYSEEETELISEVVLFGEISGRKSHGIVRLTVGKLAILALEPTDKPTVVEKTPVSTLIVGNGNPNMLVASLATKQAIRLGQEKGIGVVGTNTSFGSSGSLSYYLEKIAQEELIGVIMAQSPPHMAPHGGTESMFGTNPISFGIPAEPHPVIFDMATSAISFGDMLTARSEGRLLPEGVAIDQHGQATTDPSAAIEGAALSFDKSYKGTNLAMMVELLAGIWPEADYCGLRRERGWGNLFLVFTPNLLTDLETFKGDVERLIDAVRNSPSKDGSPIRITGEKTIKTRNETLGRGEVEVDEKLIGEIEKYLKSSAQ